MPRPTSAAHNSVYQIPRVAIPVHDSRASQLPDLPLPLANDNRYQSGFTPLPEQAPHNPDSWHAMGLPLPPQGRIPTGMRPKGVKRDRRAQLEVLRSTPAGIEKAYYALQRVRALEQRLATIVSNLDDTSLNEFLKVRPDMGRYRQS